LVLSTEIEVHAKKASSPTRRPASSGKIAGENITVSEPLFSGASHTFTNVLSVVSASSVSGWVDVFIQGGNFLALDLGYQGSAWNSPSTVSIKPLFSYYVSGGLFFADDFSGKLTTDISATPLHSHYSLMASAPLVFSVGAGSERGGRLIALTLLDATLSFACHPDEQAVLPVADYEADFAIAWPCAPPRSSSSKTAPGAISQFEYRSDTSSHSE
jgi:hypothetical protein